MMQYDSFSDLLEATVRNEETNPVAFIDNDQVTIVSSDYEEVLYEAHPHELMKELLSSLGIPNRPV